MTGAITSYSSDAVLNQMQNINIKEDLEEKKKKN